MRFPIWVVAHDRRGLFGVTFSLLQSFASLFANQLGRGLLPALDVLTMSPLMSRETKEAKATRVRKIMSQAKLTGNISKSSWRWMSKLPAKSWSAGLTAPSRSRRKHSSRPISYQLSRAWRHPSNSFPWPAPTTQAAGLSNRTSRCGNGIEMLCFLNSSTTALFTSPMASP